MAGTEAAEARPAGDSADPVRPAAAASKPVPAAGGDDDHEAAADGGGQPSIDVTVVPGITRYHREDCILIRFLGEDDLEHMTREAAVAAGCVPCKACQPDKAPEGAQRVISSWS
jgi:hypothetical protein